ncbi:MAG TPA: polysaccharide biosynthesis tyrosine autokinase [Solirubrobacteraceae bacterium]|nr:polysaccharide biosynthesis tyrosine autokinase [Solirubrobacteraceae bacterium]
MQQDSEAPSLERVLGVVRRRLPLIVLCVVIVAGAAFVLSKRQTKKYTATASLIFSDNSLNQQIAGLSASSTNSASLVAKQASDLELVRGGDMAVQTASLLRHGLTPGKVASSLSIGAQGESGVVTVSSTSTSPVIAAAIANTYSDQFVKEQETANRRYFKSALALVRKQLGALSPQQRIGQDGLLLQNRVQSLSLLSELDFHSVQVAQQALAPTVPSSPRTSRNTALGLLLGLLIGLSLAFVLERLDRRIKQPEDLEAIYGLPLLGVVPETAALAYSRRNRAGRRSILPPAEAEAFSLIRAHLRFFNVDRELRTIVIASAAPGDGKTTVARRLAEAAAGLGSRVLLLEVDLRHPTVARQFDIQAGPGLADVLIGAVPIREATQRVVLEAPPGDAARGRTLDVLCAGAVPPPNPAELLASHAMDAVLEQVKLGYDLVVIDTPPLAAVSDAFPLLTKVDGVVVVGWVARSRRDAAERLHQVFASSGAPMLGVIANGSRAGRPSSYVYARDSKSVPAVVASANGALQPEELVPTAKV